MIAGGLLFLLAVAVAILLSISVAAFGERNPDAGCADSSNRYTDCKNGTVTDTVTGLVWLKDASCSGEHDWDAAKDSTAEHRDGDCGPSDGSKPGDWRLPTLREWKSARARADELKCHFGVMSALEVYAPLGVW